MQCRSIFKVVQMVWWLINKDRGLFLVGNLMSLHFVVQYLAFASFCHVAENYSDLPWGPFPSFPETTLKRKCVPARHHLSPPWSWGLLVGAGPPGDWKGREDGAAVEETGGGGGDEEGGPEDLCARLWEGLWVMGVPSQLQRQGESKEVHRWLTLPHVSWVSAFIPAYSRQRIGKHLASKSLPE